MLFERLLPFFYAIPPPSPLVMMFYRSCLLLGLYALLFFAVLWSSFFLKGVYRHLAPKENWVEGRVSWDL